MSAVLTKGGHELPALDTSHTKHPPFLRLVSVELRKMMDTRAGLWLVISMAALTAIVMTIQLIVGLTQDINIKYADFIAGTTYSIGLLLPILGILSLTSEWGQRTAMVTFTLEPHRWRIIAAKLACVVAIAIASVAVALVLGTVANALFGAFGGTADWDFGVERLAGFAILQVLGVLTGFALAALLLNTPGAIVVYFVYSFVLPTLFAIGAELVGWINDIQPWVDFGDAQLPLGEWEWAKNDAAQLVVTSLIWLVLPLAIGLWRVLRAEVK
ncbi:ABC transporter permease [Nocardioides speluncae]|uniref:ABC transporter permease n=1 Tax=Nocardioides speluncae TaxID=2670337 RepID=UPI000D691DAF|nr:ABC transporter permease [Nocardioides speluncae]